jgi:hypothetical protein
MTRRMMKSLADVLGVRNPVADEATPDPAPPKRMSARAFSRSILSSQEYRASLMRRIVTDELPPALETRLYDYAYGQPVKRLEVKDTTPPNRLSELSLQELEQRALFYADMLRRLQHEEPATPDAPREDEPPPPPTSVH